MSRRLRKHRQGLAATSPGAVVRASDIVEVQVQPSIDCAPYAGRRLPDKPIEEYTQDELRAGWCYCKTEVAAMESGFVKLLLGPICAGIAARLPQEETGQTDYERSTADRLRLSMTLEEQRQATHTQYPWIDPAFGSRLNDGIRTINELRRRGKALLAGKDDCQFDTGMIVFDAPCGPEAFAEYVWRADLYAHAQRHLNTLVNSVPVALGAERRAQWIHLVQTAIKVAEEATATKREWLYPHWKEIRAMAPYSGMSTPDATYKTSGLPRAPLDVQKFLSGFRRTDGRRVDTELFVDRYVWFGGGAPDRTCIHQGVRSGAFACRQDVSTRDLYLWLLAQPDGGVVDMLDLAQPGAPFYEARRVHGGVEPRGSYHLFPKGLTIVEAFRRWGRFFVETPYEHLVAAQAAPRFLNASIEWGNLMASRYDVPFEQVMNATRADLEALARDLQSKVQTQLAADGAGVMSSIPVLGEVLAVLTTVAYGWFFELVGRTQCPTAPPYLMTRTLKDTACTFDPNQVGVEPAYNRVVEAGKSVGLHYPDVFRETRVPPPGEEAKAPPHKAVAFGIAAAVGVGLAYLFA